MHKQAQGGFQRVLLKAAWFVKVELYHFEGDHKYTKDIARRPGGPEEVLRSFYCERICFTFHL